MLNVLLVNQGRVLSQNDIAAQVWPDADGGPDRALELVSKYVAELRTRGWPIVSRYGRGYVIPWTRRVDA